MSPKMPNHENSQPKPSQGQEPPAKEAVAQPAASASASSPGAQAAVPSEDLLRAFGPGLVDGLKDMIRAGRLRPEEFTEDGAWLKKAIKSPERYDLEEGLRSMIAGGRLAPCDIPDDFEWLTQALLEEGEDQTPRWEQEHGKEFNCPPLPEGMEDLSWRHDACPSYGWADEATGEELVRIWIDHPDAEKRENGPEWPRFGVHSTHLEHSDLSYGEGEWDQAVAKAHELLPLAKAAHAAAGKAGPSQKTPIGLAEATRIKEFAESFLNANEGPAGEAFRYLYDELCDGDVEVEDMLADALVREGYPKRSLDELADHLLSVLQANEAPKTRNKEMP